MDAGVHDFNVLVQTCLVRTASRVGRVERADMATIARERSPVYPVSWLGGFMSVAPNLGWPFITLKHTQSMYNSALSDGLTHPARVTISLALRRYRTPTQRNKHFAKSFQFLTKDVNRHHPFHDLKNVRATQSGGVLM